jgi:hypothetical protein
MAAATDRFVAWCKQEQASIEQELELMASGKVRIGEDIGKKKSQDEQREGSLHVLSPLTAKWSSSLRGVVLAL